MQEPTLILELLKVAGPVAGIAAWAIYLMYKLASNHMEHLQEHFGRVENRLDRIADAVSAVVGQFKGSE